jgi:hypothetical protein
MVTLGVVALWAAAMLTPAAGPIARPVSAMIPISPPAILRAAVRTANSVFVNLASYQTPDSSIWRDAVNDHIWPLLNGEARVM